MHQKRFSHYTQLNASDCGPVTLHFLCTYLYLSRYQWQARPIGSGLKRPLKKVPHGKRDKANKDKSNKVH